MQYNSYSITNLSNKGLFIIVSVIAFVFSGLLSPAYASKGWGSKPLAEKYRPNKSWINNFSATPNVTADGSIADAIDDCDNVVGAGKYCVVEVTNTATGLPLEIFRSKTKLVGVANMTPLTTSENVIFIYIGDNTKQVILENLNLQGHNAGDNEIYGIFVEGKNIRNILIRNNKIHDFNSNSDAHGIAVYGTGATNRQGIRHVTIEGNEVYSMRTGSSESIVINGNVRRWEIKANDVYDVNNIAIDAIGGEGKSPTREDRRGRILPGALDAASYGFIEDNFVENMSTAGNPAYGNEESWAAAIYIDGGHHIHVANNVVENASWGYEMGAENCLTTRYITVTGNSATGSTFGDLLLGGYAENGYRADRTINCNPNNSSDEHEGHGYVKFLTVKNNTFTSTNTSEELITLQFRITNTIIVAPTISSINTDRNGAARGDQNAIWTGTTDTAPSEVMEISMPMSMPRRL